MSTLSESIRETVEAVGRPPAGAHRWGYDSGATTGAGPGVGCGRYGERTGPARCPRCRSACCATRARPTGSWRRWAGPILASSATPPSGSPSGAAPSPSCAPIPRHASGCPPAAAARTPTPWPWSWRRRAWADAPRSTPPTWPRERAEAGTSSPAALRAAQNGTPALVGTATWTSTSGASPRVPAARPLLQRIVLGRTASPPTGHRVQFVLCRGLLAGLG
jgi:hypothetical protein